MSSPATGPPYAGNPSLPAEVREKILSTFRHALNLFTSGNVNDCLIGCEFILKMDPRFTPARRLQEKVRNRNSDVDISELQAAATSAPSAVSSLAPSEPALPELTAQPETPTAPRVETPDPQRLLAEAAKKYDAMDLEGAIAAATRALTLLPGNAEALRMIEKAAARKAARPLVESTRARAEQALTEGRVSEARLELERLRALDSEDSAIALLERRLSAAASAQGESAPMPDFSLDPHGPDPFAPGPQEGDIFSMSGVSSEPAGLDPFSSGAPRPAAPPPRRPQPPPPAPAPPAVPQAASSDLFLPAEEPEMPMMPSMTAPPTAAEEEDTRSSEREIAALLRQGDETARKGERQQAIEVWSRVFLIDINNADAVTRIEKARQEMADKSRLVADSLKKGRDSFESGDREGARKSFLQALELDPQEATARLYLERIEQAKGEPTAPAPSPGGGKTAASARGVESSDAPAFPPAVAPTPARRLKAPRLNPRVLALIGAFLALTLVGVYFFVFKGSKNRDAQPADVAATASLQNARDLLAKGKIAEARAELRRIGPGDADAAEAQRMLAELGRPGGAAPGGKGAASEPLPGGAAREGHADNDPTRLRAVAEKALAEKRYIDALKNFNLAAPAFRDDPEFTKAQGLASDKVTALTPAVKFYNEGEYETAIPILWRIVQEDRENRDARAYLLRSYYNQGISHLQNGLYGKAAQAFHEALALDPTDAEAVRHQKFAERYQKGELDLMGRIYVRHLNHRP